MTEIKKIIALVAMMFVAANGEAVQLTHENFEELRGGKNAFVKFLAPW